MDKLKVQKDIIDNTIENHEGCWIWTKSCFSTGYGQKKIAKKSWRVHKLSYLVFKGKIEDGLIIRHLCGNRRCCNPIHLESGTLKENSKDTILHGRSYFHNLDQKGDKNTASVLTEDSVYKSRNLYSQGKTMSEIAKHFKVSRKAIERAVRGKTYTDFNKVPPIKSKRCDSV